MPQWSSSTVAKCAWRLIKIGQYKTIKNLKITVTETFSTRLNLFPHPENWRRTFCRHVGQSWLHCGKPPYRVWYTGQACPHRWHTGSDCRDASRAHSTPDIASWLGGFSPLAAPPPGCDLHLIGPRAQTLSFPDNPFLLCSSAIRQTYISANSV